MARATPLLGHDGPFGAQMGMTPFNDVRFGLLGGSIVDSNALLRAYIWHCVAIPIMASAFMVVHFWRVRKDGGISGPAPVDAGESEIKERGGVSHGLHQLWTMSAPDNVPIVGALPVAVFYTYWLGRRSRTTG